MSAELQGKVAIVTGGGTGIGAAIAARLASNGASVVITGRRPEPLQEQVAKIQAAGGKVCAIPGDTADEASVDALFAEVDRTLGAVDILVNNAAIAGPVAPIWEQDAAGWEDTLRINLTGPFLCTRAAVKQMMPRKSGKIVMIGSISGKRPLAARTPYTSTKMGLVGLVRTLALELGPFNINVNLISPGAVDTPRLAELAEKYKVPLEEIIQKSAATRSLNRIPSTDSIANMVDYLVSDRSRDITGIDITVDAGGWFD